MALTAIDKKEFLNGIINSYSQVFFSKKPIFAIALMVVSFFDIYAGLAGILAVIFTNSVALSLGFNKQKIYSGAYAFNSLLVGLGLGIYYQPGSEFYLVLFFISICTLFLTIGFEGILGKYGLPYLSFPFLIGIWIVIIASKGYSALNISERGIYNLNDMYAIGGASMVHTYEWFNNLNIPESLRVYFKSLSAIFFQYHMFAGLIIAAGLLYHSRISFLVSLLGFYSAYFFYNIIGADISELTYSYIGFNYILMSIAIGGFFIVPSVRSILWVILLTPIVAIILSSTAYLFSFYQLSVFSLPFNIVVVLFIYALKFREKPDEKLALVVAQEYSPENHVYNYNSFVNRFSVNEAFGIKLPFFGKWKITQAHNGEHTHKGDWRYAWDFEMEFEGDLYSGEGDLVEDYYCFNKPIIAVADGIVVEVENSHEDNQIGNMNLTNNWGNTVVVKHSEFLFSKLSHLKEDSIKVNIGQFVKQGEILGHCGNSGRSPIPHIHMQLQSTPSIGSKTIDYPISSFVIEDGDNFQFKTSDIPKKDEFISNVIPNKLMASAYNFVPGQILKFKSDDENQITHSWEVKSDIFNNTYLQCSETSSIAWFKNIDDVFYFTSFEGNHESLLYYFFLSSYKLLNAFYDGLVLSDELPLTIYPHKGLKLIQDSIIPFTKFLKADYKMTYEKEFEENNQKYILLKSSAKFGINNKVRDTYNFEIILSDKGIETINILQAKNEKVYTRVFN